MRVSEKRATSSRSSSVQSGREQKHGHREQVAAVCYRFHRGSLEFLLVRTRGGRWTFPKGGAMKGLTRSESAGLEALEEAGVRGRIEEAPFATYKAFAKTLKSETRNSDGQMFSITAYLCEVISLSIPRERKRAPNWFRPEKAKKRLREDRLPHAAIELSRVIDRAEARIHRLQNTLPSPTDPLRKSYFEFAEFGRGNCQEATPGKVRLRPGEINHVEPLSLSMPVATKLPSVSVRGLLPAQASAIARMPAAVARVDNRKKDR